MTYVGHALAYATLPAENSTKFSSCSGTFRYKRPNDTSDASRGWGAPSTTSSELSLSAARNRSGNQHMGAGGAESPAPWRPGRIYCSERSVRNHGPGQSPKWGLPVDVSSVPREESPKAAPVPQSLSGWIGGGGAGERKGCRPTTPDRSPTHSSMRARKVSSKL